MHTKKHHTSIHQHAPIWIVVGFLIFTAWSVWQQHPNVLPGQYVGEPEINLEPYCKNGYYEIPGEAVCSRAPYCGGYGYDELDTMEKEPNPQSCMGDGVAGRAGKGCAGYVPLCCYEMARTGKFTKCIGYWERKWCAPSQCNVAKSRGASDKECGDTCGCSSAFKSYCGNKEPIPLSQRLSGNSVPTGKTVNIADFSDKPENTSPNTHTFGVTIPSTISSDTANEIKTLFSGIPITLRVVQPPVSMVQNPVFLDLHPSFDWYFTFSSYDTMRTFLTAYYTKPDAKKITVGLTTTADGANTQSILSQFPNVSFEAQEFGFWPRDAVKSLIGHVPPPTLHAISLRLSQSEPDVYKDAKVLFDTVWDAVRDVPGTSVKIGYPPNTHLSLVDIRFDSTIEGISRKANVISDTIVASVNGTKSNNAPILTIIAGDYSMMSSQEKPIIRAFAQFINDAPDIFYPWTISPEPFDTGNNAMPAWGIAGVKNGKVYAIFTNTSNDPITLKFPDAYSISSTENIYSTTRGNGTFVQNNAISLSGHETIALVSNISLPNSPSSTPIPPGAPTDTPGIPPQANNSPTPSNTPKPTKTPRPSLTAKPIVKRVPVTIPVMAVKLGQPTEAQSLFGWISVLFEYVLPGKYPSRAPTPTPSITPVQIAQQPSPVPGGLGTTLTPTPIGFIPSPTPSPIPLPCPDTSTNTYEMISEHLPSYPAGDPPANTHPDLNISMRGYETTINQKEIINMNGPQDPQAPQLIGLLHRIPTFSEVYRVYDWDWVNNRKGNLYEDYEVTMLGLSTTPGESLYPPASGHTIGEDKPVSTDPFQVMVVYADKNQIAIKYDRVDSAKEGFLFHIQNICTDPNLLALYNQKQYNTPSQRTSLIALRTRDPFGTARTGEVRIVTRDHGRFLDPRARKDWWIGH